MHGGTIEKSEETSGAQVVALGAQFSDRGNAVVGGKSLSVGSSDDATSVLAISLLCD